MIPARRSTANSCSRNCTGTSRRRASSPIGTGPEPALRPSSASASTAYGDLLVIEIIAGQAMLGNYSQPRSVAISTACARSTAPSLP